MVYTTEEITDNIPLFPMNKMIIKKLSARKSLPLFTNIFDVKKRTDIRRVGAAESKRISVKDGCGLQKKNRKGHSKINEQVKRKLYKWITPHPQVVKSPVSNDFHKVIIKDQTEPQRVPIFLLQVSGRELYNSLISVPNDVGLKEVRYEENNIIISDSTLRTLLPPQ